MLFFFLYDIISMVIVMKFTKMHGLGNDYIYINEDVEGNIDYSNLAILLSKRHFAVGADGIITISKSDKADFFMQIYNADGSKGEMCGNGIRCVGKYVYDKHLTDKTHLTIDTLAGIKILDLNVENGKVSSVKVDMGEPLYHDGRVLQRNTQINELSHIINIFGVDYEVMDVSMGNPHTVLFVPGINDDLVLNVGREIEKHPFYPNRTNVEFVKKIDNKTLQMRVYERGSGETYACGTGSCASVVAYLLKNNIDDEVTVKLLGGDLKISWDKNNNHVYMDGPATKVYEGEIDIEDLL